MEFFQQMAEKIANSVSELWSSSSKDNPPPSASASGSAPKPVFSATAFSSASTAPPGTDTSSGPKLHFKPAPGSAGTPALPGGSVHKTASNSFNNLNVQGGSNVGLLELAMMFTNVGDLVTNVYNSVTNIVNYLSPESKPEKPIEPKTPEEVVNVTNNYIRAADLDQFYRADDPFLRKLAEKASVRIGDPAIALNTSQDAVDLTKLALYNNVILCDDSGSMNRDGRIPALKALLARVSKITTELDTDGIDIRFLNFAHDAGFNNLRTTADIQNAVAQVAFRGDTRIGTTLRKKILEPLVYAKIRAKSLQRPVLVTIITDGEPNEEDPDEMKKAIIECKHLMLDHGYLASNILFQISQIGNSEEAEGFIQNLHDEPESKGLIYCTSEKLDEQMKLFNDRNTDLERWLLRTLVAPMNARAHLLDSA